MSFDPVNPGLSFTSAEWGTALLVPAAGGDVLTVTQDPASYAADVAIGGDKGALVLFQHNDGATGRAQSVGVPVLEGAETAQLPPAVAADDPAAIPAG
jgi:hypothetical protein